MFDPTNGKKLESAYRKTFVRVPSNIAPTLRSPDRGRAAMFTCFHLIKIRKGNDKRCLIVVSIAARLEWA